MSTKAERCEASGHLAALIKSAKKRKDSEDLHHALELRQGIGALCLEIEALNSRLEISETENALFRLLADGCKKEQSE